MCLFVHFIGWGFLGFLSPPFFSFASVPYFMSLTILASTYNVEMPTKHTCTSRNISVSVSIYAVHSIYNM